MALEQLQMEALAFLDAIAIGETYSPHTLYNGLYGGGTFSDFSKFPHWEGKDNSHAAGRYQFEPATWQGVAKELGLSDFSPQSQDQAAWKLACDVYKHRSNRDLLNDLQRGHVYELFLNSTWTSINQSFNDRLAGSLLARRMMRRMMQPPKGD